MYAVVAVLSHLTHSPLVAEMMRVVMNIFLRSAEFFRSLHNILIAIRNTLYPKAIILL